MRSLHERCFRDVVTSQFGQWDNDQQREFFDKKWNPSNYQIIGVDNTDAGVISVFAHTDHVWLSEIQVDPAFQNRGLGSRVVQDIVDHARAENLPVRLQVLHKNRAKELYLRLGFQEVDRTETHVKMERKSSP